MTIPIAAWPRALYNLTLAVAEAHEPADIFEAALDALENSIHVSRSSLLLFDNRGVMRFRAWRDLSDDYRAAVDGHSPWLPNTADATPILVADVQRDSSLQSLQEVFRREDIAALGFVPLRLGSRLLGKFMLYYREPHDFTEEEVLTASTIAAHVAFALDQQARRDGELRYKSLAETAPALVATTTSTGEISDVDEAYRSYTGLTQSEARDWEAHTIIHPDDLDQAMQAWNQAMRIGSPLQNEMRLRRFDGTYRWHLMTAKPVADTKGSIHKWITVSVDIEDRKLREARDRYLAKTTARLLTPIDGTDALAAVANLAVPELANICSIGLFDGTSRTARIETAVDDSAKRSAVEQVHLREWNWLAAGRETIGAAIARGETVYIADTSAAWIAAAAPDPDQVNAARAIAPRSLVCVPLISRGTTFGMATFAVTGSRRPYSREDVSLLEEVAARLSIALENRGLYETLRATAEELRLANEAKDEFLGLISHELKTPLTIIRGNASVLEKGGNSLVPEMKDTALADIVAESERLHRIIENLLMLARAQQGQTLAAEPVLLVRIAQTVVARHNRTAPDRAIQVIEHSAPRPVMFSEACLELVLENLLSNAEKYSPADTPIVVEIERDDDSVTLRVMDEGPGIAAHEEEAVFEPFFRSESTSKRAQGLGIGLAVCKRLVETQGGVIWGKNRARRGAEFGFRIQVTNESD